MMPKVSGPIIVGYDGSDAAQEAVRTACQLREEGTVVTVVHAFDVPFQVDVYPWFSDFRDACRDVAEEVVGAAREFVSGDERAILYEAIEGKPADALARKAKEIDADMIVVGSRGLGAVRAAIGSVTLRLIHRAPCPVLVVHAREDADTHLA
jgi:nucleotide-binding universal stress UspA family protein